MLILFLTIILKAILISGSSLSDKVDQKPLNAFKNPGESAIIHCSHRINGYNRILWYKQQNRQLEFLGYMLAGSGNPEKGLDVTIEGSADEGKNCTLTINSLSVSSSAVYFCAADNSLEPAYFGKGTKLTVLETDLKVTPPTNVKILPPSPNECRNQKDKKRKKTLVCVASGFYPDHVKVLWKINEKEAKDGVATDSAAERQVDKFYRITSRLRVPAEDYNTASNTFTCIVSFFDGEKTTFNETSINGIQGKTEGGMTREEYLRLTQSAKLSYTVVIVKSCFYGVFVGVLVWKLQGSARKHH